LAKLLPSKSHPLLKKKKTGKQLLVLVSPDRGLTGSLMTYLSTTVTEVLLEQTKVKNMQTDVRAIGTMGANFAKRSGFNVVRVEKNDRVSTKRARQLKDQLVDAYVKGGYEKIILAYTQFETTLKQRPFVRGILPLTEEKILDVEELPESLADASIPPLTTSVYDVEPSPQRILDELVPDLVTMLLYHVLEEASASEHSARMIAMKNAHDNASDLIDELTQTFNRLRQESITRALAEISAGVAALEKS
jgi:F-type H+-transporting ATPase subunit gamma